MLVCIWFQGWLLCTGQPTRGSHPWEDSFSFSQQSLIGCISFPGVGCHTILFCVNRSIDIAIVPVLFMQPFLGETSSQQTLWSSGCYDLSTPDLWCSISHRLRNCDVDVSMGLTSSWSADLCLVPRFGFLEAALMRVAATLSELLSLVWL